MAGFWKFFNPFFLLEQKPGDLLLNKERFPAICRSPKKSSSLKEIKKVFLKLSIFKKYRQQNKLKGQKGLKEYDLPTIFLLIGDFKKMFNTSIGKLKEFAMLLYPNFKKRLFKQNSSAYCRNAHTRVIHNFRIFLNIYFESGTSNPILEKKMPYSTNLKLKKTLP